MDHSVRRQKSDMQQSSGFLASLHIIDNILNWLVGFILLTEEEQEDAGVYPGGRQLYK